MNAHQKQPWPPLVLPPAGHSEAFVKQVNQARAKARFEASREELTRQGISSFRRWGMPVWARDILRDVSDRTGVCIGELASSSRYRRVVLARNEAMYLVKARKPVLSSTKMGKWFNRYHTTVLYSVASHQERTGLPKLAGYDVAKARIRKREWITSNRSSMGKGDLR